MPIIVERHGPVTLLTISRPEVRNAWCEAFNEELPRLFAALEEDDGVRCVVVTGDEAGRAFSAGADLGSARTHRVRSPEEFVKELPHVRKLAIALPENFPKPVLAAVNGHAIGIGCTFTYACDLIIASERASWRLAQVQLGLVPKYGSLPRLARRIGQGGAMRMALGFPMGGEEAFRCGLAQWLVPHDQLMARTMEIAEHIAALPPLAVRLVKESLLRGMDTANLADASLVDLYRFMALEGSEAVRASHAAWQEKTRSRTAGDGE